jgi:flagellar hook-basal body complex protein FliE
MNTNIIKPLTPIEFPKVEFQLKPEETPEKVNFSEVIMGQIHQLNELEAASSKITSDFAAGKIDNIHEVMIAAEKSSLALSLAVQIKTKLTEAYSEIIRMQV